MSRLKLTNPQFGTNTFIRRRVNELGYYATLYPPQTKNPQQDLPQQKGSFNECMFNLIASQYFPESAIEFDSEAAWKQFVNGRSGNVDAGWDIVVNGLTIDVKYDSKMYEQGVICFEIKNSKGNGTLLLNKAVNYSAHMSYFERNLSFKVPSSVKNAHNKGLQLVIVDLDGLRQHLKEDAGAYKIGAYASRVTRFNTVCVDIPVQYLTHTLKVADSYLY